MIKPEKLSTCHDVARGHGVFSFNENSARARDLFHSSLETAAEKLFNYFILIGFGG